MTGLLSAALVLLGAHLAIRLVAALYRIIDLWHGIGRYWPVVLRGVLGWSGGLVATAVLLPDRLRPAFLFGAAGFVLFYLGMYLVRYPLVRRTRKP
jgi:hypothetical protein